MKCKVKLNFFETRRVYNELMGITVAILFSVFGSLAHAETSFSSQKNNIPTVMNMGGALWVEGGNALPGAQVGILGSFDQVSAGSPSFSGW